MDDGEPGTHPTELRWICFERMLLEKAVLLQLRNELSLINGPDHTDRFAQSLHFHVVLLASGGVMNSRRSGYP